MSSSPGLPPLPSLYTEPSDPNWHEGKPAVFLCPLMYVSSDVRAFKLFDGMSVRTAQPSDQRLFNTARKSHGLFSSLYRSATLVTGEYVIEVRSTARNFDRDRVRAIARIERLVTAFRILGFSPYAAGGYAFHPRDKASAVAFYPTMDVDRLPFDTSSQHLIDRKGIARLRQIDRNIGKCSKRTGIAIRRFNRIFSRESDEDRIIDLWVALEALFSPGDLGEHTYRTALRIVSFMQPPDGARLPLHDFLTDSYALRSAVVHGRGLSGRSKKLGLEPSVVIRRTFEYLRSALQKIIEGDPAFTADDLDEAIIRGS